MKLHILIPEDILVSNISSDAKILYGIMATSKGFDLNVDIFKIPFIKDIDSCLSELKEVSKINIPEKEDKSKPIKNEDWNDPDIGILVGPNNKPMYRLRGVYLTLFLKMWELYENKNGKRNAAWAFYSTIKPILDNLPDAEAKQSFSRKVLAAVKRARSQNIIYEAEGRTPQYLQGWITSMKFEDFD